MGSEGEGIPNRAKAYCRTADSLAALVVPLDMLIAEAGSSAREEVFFRSRIRALRKLALALTEHSGRTLVRPTAANL
jgi:hypothetical protein